MLIRSRNREPRSPLAYTMSEPALVYDREMYKRRNEVEHLPAA